MSPLLLALLTVAPALAQASEDAPVAGQAAEAPAEAAPLPLTQGPQLVDFAEAPYPPDAAEQRVEGSVMLVIEIDETGAVTAVEPGEEPLVPGADGQPRTWGFSAAAADAALGWRFSPAMDETGPVPVAISFAYDFLLPPEPIEQPVAVGPAQISGVLVEMGTRRGLHGFPILATTGDGAVVETLTDDDGRFSLAGLPAGPVEISSVYPGYARVTEDAMAPADGPAVELKLWMRNLSYRDDEIVGIYRLPPTDVTRRTLTMDEVRKVPGTFGDPVRVVQNLPGAARAPLGTGLLVIRGANPEDSGVYVDGVRIPFIYHLGGYSSVINSDLIDRVDYLPGSYGVDYGRSMGGVIDVATKSEFPERKHASWSTDLLDSGGMVTGRFGKEQKLGLAVAARRSYIDVFIPTIQRIAGSDPDFVVKPRWYDYQVKVERLDMDKGHVGAFLFGFQDILRASTPDDFAQGTDEDTQGDLGTAYDTHRLLLTFERPLTDKLTLEVVPSLGLDTAAFNLGNSLGIEQWQLLTVSRAELMWKVSDALTLRPGMDFIGGWFGFDVQFPFNPDDFASYDPLGERQPWGYKDTGSAWAPDVWFEARWTPLRDRSKLLVIPGLRLNYDIFPGQFDIISFDPRISTRFQAVRGGTLKAGTGLYHQPPQPFESYRPDDRGVIIDFERAWSSEVGWEQELGTGLQADLAVFYKKLDDQIVDNPDFQSLDDQFNTNDGIGRVAGLEFIVRQAPVHRFFGWLSYTLSRSIRNNQPDRAGADQGLWPEFDTDKGWYAYDFDQTHILVVVGGYNLPRDWEISGKAQYVTGNPYTPYSGGIYDVDQDSYTGFRTGAYNSERMPEFTAVDLRIDKLLTFKRWQLELYLDLLNVYRGENPEFVTNNYDYTESAFIRGLPFIPSPGFEAEFDF